MRKTVKTNIFVIVLIGFVYSSVEAIVISSRDASKSGPSVPFAQSEMQQQISILGLRNIAAAIRANPEAWRAFFESHFPLASKPAKREAPAPPAQPAPSAPSESPQEGSMVDLENLLERLRTNPNLSTRVFIIPQRAGMFIPGPSGPGTLEPIKTEVAANGLMLVEPLKPVEPQPGKARRNYDYDDYDDNYPYEDEYYYYHY